MVYPHAMSHSVPHVFSHVQAFGRTGFRASDVPQSEATILIELYGDTAGGAWTDNTSWKTKATVNDWYGITVGSGHVTGLDLSSNNLVGVIPASLGSLSEVTAIDLSGNTLTGLDAFVVALAASVASNPRAGTLNISGASMEALTYGTEGSPSDSALAIMALLDADWVVTVTGESTIATHSVAAGDTKLATADGEAMVFDDNVDLSPHAETTRWLEFVDGDDNVAKAYVKDVGEGEALGIDLLSGWDFTSGWNETNATINSSTSYTTDAYWKYIYKFLAISEGELCKIILDGTGTNGDPVSYGSGVFNNTFRKSVGTNYATFSTVNFRLSAETTGTSSVVTISQLECYILTDVPATGLRLVNTVSGSTRNMTSVDTEFNPNDIRTIRVKDVMPEWVLSTQTVTAGTVKLATEDTGAMAFGDGLDWSGVATGSLFRATDESGNKCEGYVWKAGTGITYGSNLAPTNCCTDPDNDADVTTGWTSASSALLSSESGGRTGYCLQVTENGEDNPYARLNGIVVSPGELFNFKGFVKEGTGTLAWLRLYDQSGNSVFFIVYITVETVGDWSNGIDNIKTIPTGCTRIQVALFNSSASGSGLYILFDDIEFKKLTDVPTTGIHFESSPGEADGTLSLKETGFDPNAIVKVEFIGVP